VATKALKFRLEQKEILHGSNEENGNSLHHDHNCSHSVAAKKRRTLGDVTTLNITRLHTGGGGVEAYNVVPAICEMALDIRISPHVPPSEMRDALQQWCDEAEAAVTGLPATGGVTWEYHINKVRFHDIDIFLRSCIFLN
jgi:acetylornithine deacetylase/succinyl-diaminopimelate desuccinylase-like protein